MLTAMHFGTDISSNALSSPLYLSVGPLTRSDLLFAYLGVIKDNSSGSYRMFLTWKENTKE